MTFDWFKLKNCSSQSDDRNTNPVVTRLANQNTPNKDKKLILSTIYFGFLSWVYKKALDF